MKLHFGNLHKEVTDSQFRDLVKPFGEVGSAEVARDRDGTSKGFAFAEYADASHAQAAITGLDGKDVSGQALRVSEARPRKSDAARPANA